VGLRELSFCSLVDFYLLVQTYYDLQNNSKLGECYTEHMEKHEGIDLPPVVS
jgi:hypothetical protein